ncbi:MAG: acyl-CoA dehydrogenase family protein [Microbacterium sp.]
MLSEEALEVGVVLREGIAAAGGVDLLRRAVADPAQRAVAGDLLDSVGLWDLDPLSDPLELEVAAAACQAAGYFALPYPIVERIGRRDAEATMLVARTGTRVAAHADLPLEWSALDLNGDGYRFVGVDDALSPVMAPFGRVIRVEAGGRADPAGAALLSTLQSWWLLGLLEHALADTAQYTREREQFGRALIKFQGVSFQLAEMTVEAQALLELAKYTLWTVADHADSALVDAVALRSAAQRAAAVVLRGAHQLHGAMGFTSEVDISWLSRASQLARRTPEGMHATSGLLTSMIVRDGWPDLGRADAEGQLAVRR